LAFQGEAIVEQPLIIGMPGRPIFLQGVLMLRLGLRLNLKCRVQAQCPQGPSAMIGASNFFEGLLVAVASYPYTDLTVVGKHSPLWWAC